MFDDNTKQAWQTIQPDPGLKARALAQKPAKTVAFPVRKAVRALTSAAACLVVALVLLNPAPQVTLTGHQPGPAAVAFSRQTTAGQQVTLLLDYDGKSQLTPSEGSLETQGDQIAWHLPGPGRYTLTATRGRRTTQLSFLITQDPSGWSIQVQ